MPPQSHRYRAKNIKFRPDTLIIDRQSPDVLFLNDILTELRDLKEVQKETLEYIKSIQS